VSRRDHLTRIACTINMSESLRRNAPLLRALSKASPATRKRILKSRCTPDFIACIRQCAQNVIKGNIPLTGAQLNALRRKKRFIKQLVLKRTSPAKRKKLVQSGGFLGALLGPIVSVLSSILTSGS
jgi:hypothetical protein